jgi:hypothetical protein
MNFLEIGSGFAQLFIMLTRRDILMELKRMGVRKQSLLKSYLRDFEKYIGAHYNFTVLKTKKGPNDLRNRDPESYQDKSLSPRS